MHMQHNCAICLCYKPGVRVAPPSLVVLVVFSCVQLTHEDQVRYTSKLADYLDDHMYCVNSTGAGRSIYVILRV